jgi:hypothetical protein
MPDDAGSGKGWRVIATLRHRPGQPTRVELNGDGTPVDTEAWSRSEGWCEHCRTRRARRTTYLLRHDSGRLAQVGSSCVAAFVASANGSRHHRPLPGGGRRHHRGPAAAIFEYADTHAFVAHVAQTVFDRGWISVAAATRREPPTWSTAVAALDRGHAPSAKAARRARQAIVWARHELSCRDRLTDFEQRLVDVVGRDRLTRRELPTAAAVIHAFHCELRDRIDAREKLGEHIGEPGEAITSTFTVHRVERLAKTTGPVHRHFMTDNLGRLGVWDADAATVTRGTHRLLVTVAAHADLDGRPVTVLGHCCHEP